MKVQAPASLPGLPLVKDLGSGERQVLALGLEIQDTVVLLDDAFARRVAEAIGLRFTGTIGILLDAKRAGLIASVTPTLNALDSLGFRLSQATRRTVLKIAGESHGT